MRNHYFGKLIVVILISSVACAQWTLMSQDGPHKEDMTVEAKPQGRRSAALWTLEGLTYVFGGKGALGRLNDLWQFEPQTRRWIWLPDAPITLTPRSGMIHWAYEGQLWLWGGRDDLGTAFDECWAYYPPERKWSLKTIQGNIPAARHDAAFWIRHTTRHIYMYGGVDTKANKTLEDLWTFDMDALHWAQLTHGGDLPGPRENARATLGPGQEIVYLFGGLNEQQLPIGRLKQLDLSNMIWSDALNVDHEHTPRARSDHVLWMGENGKTVFLFGGKTGDQLHSDQWSYDTQTHTWNQLATGGPSERWGAAYELDMQGALSMFGGTYEDPTHMHNDVWNYGSLTPFNLLNVIEFKLDATTIGALLGGIMSTIAVGLLALSMLVFCVRFCRQRRRNRRIEDVPLQEPLQPLRFNEDALPFKGPSEKALRGRDSGPLKVKPKTKDEEEEESFEDLL